MRLQPKKSNKLAPPVFIAAIFLFSLLYWLYLSLTTRMVIVFDAFDYDSIGRMIYNHGWSAYFATGPNREPFYPLLVAVSLHIEHLTGSNYLKIMAFFGIILLFLTQALTYIIMRLLDIRNGTCALVLAYLALSPAINNAAFSLFSEILILPFILVIVLIGFYAWEAIKTNDPLRAFIFGALLGVSLTAATFIKAVFEGITPIYLIIIFSAIFFTDQLTIKKDPKPFILCILAALIFFYVPVTDFKCLNFDYNGNFVITNRGSWLLYRDAEKRMAPLTVKRFAEALAYAPGEGVCNSIFGSKECAFWSFPKSSELGFTKAEALKYPPLSSKQINPFLIHLSEQQILHNPFQYLLLTAIEGSKMLFWESTQIGFVQYPDRLQKIYDKKILNNALRFLMSLLTLMALMHLCSTVLKPPGSPIGFMMCVLIFLYTLFFSFFVIITRYAIPLAPLFLIAISLWIEQNPFCRPTDSLQ